MFLHKKSSSLKQLCFRVRAAESLESKCFWRRERQKYWRRWKTLKCQEELDKKHRKSHNNIVKLSVYGVLTSNRKLWKSGVKTFLNVKYSDPLVTEESQNDAIIFLRVWQHVCELDGLQAPDLTFNTTMRARGRLKRKTSAGGGYNIVLEMLLVLSWIGCIFVHSCIISRY